MFPNPGNRIVHIKFNPMKQVIAKDKWRTLPSIFSDFFDNDRFFPSGMLDMNGGTVFPWWGVEKMPSVNITERDKDFLIELAAPGLEKKDFRVEVDNDLLTISAEKEEEKEEKENGLTRKEFSFNKFSRSFRLPENAKFEQIDATYADGILRILVPKKAASAAKVNKAIAVR